MPLRHLYTESFIYEYAIIREMMTRNTDISVDMESRGYLTGQTSYEWVPQDDQDECDKIAKSIVNYLVYKEPSLFEQHVIANIKFSKPMARTTDKRTLIFTDKDGKEIGLCIKTSAFAIRHMRAMPPSTMIHYMYQTELDGIELDSEYDKNIATYEEISNNREDVYKRYLDLYREMHLYATEHITDAPKLLCQTLVGNTDYYCINLHSRLKMLRIMAFNMNGTLNAPLVPYPTKLLVIQNGNYSTSSFKNNMITLIFDEGWMVTSRIHLGALAEKGRPVSLKYDIALKGLPYHIESEAISWEV